MLRWLFAGLCCGNNMIMHVIGARGFELFPVLKVVLKEIVSSTVISCVVRLRLRLSALLQVKLRGLCTKLKLHNEILV